MSRGRRAGAESERVFDGLVSAVYEAALGSLTWDELLPRIVRFVGGARGGLGVRQRGTSGGFVSSDNIDPEIAARWASEFAGYDPWIERFADRKGVGDLLHAGSEPVHPWVRATDVYAEIFGPMGVDDLLVSVVAARGSWRGYVGVYRSPSEGLFDESAVARARRLTPHLVRGAAIAERIGGLGEEAAAAEAVLECVPYGVLLLGASGDLVWANRRGETLLRSDSLLGLRAGAVRAREPRLDAKLAEACAAAGQIAAGGAANASSAVWVAQDATGRRLEILAIPVGPRSGATALSFTAQRARVALLLADPSDSTRLPAEAVGAVLELPPALARLAAAISSGRTVVEYAAEAGVTEGTARQQLKELLARSGVRRQADLVRIVQRSVAALEIPDSLSD